MDAHAATPRTRDQDAGTALPIVIVITTVIALVVVTLSSYALASLRFGRVAENRSDRLTAADAGMRYAIDQLALRNAGCILDTQKAVLPGVEADFNGAGAEVTCERITSGFEGIQAYAAVMTGEGMPSTQSLLSSQSGSNSKILGGPVYMARVTPDAFSLSPPVQIEDGPLLYHDTTSGSASCTSVKASTMPSKLIFEPALLFGPVCVKRPWTEIFDSPEVPDLTSLVERRGDLPLGSSLGAPAQGSYTDVTSGGGCRVFKPGRYTTPPVTSGDDAYFETGEYLFDFDATWEVRQSIVTAGRIDPAVTNPPVNELATTNACAAAQTADAQNPGTFGATFYFARKAHLNIATQGSIEVHARRQGADYVSVQTLCAPNLPTVVWCNADGGGGFVPAKASTLSGAVTASNPNFLYTDSGNNKEFIAHALVYAPKAQVEFGNVTNTATQRMLGGLVVARLVLQSSTSATNFEIAVPTSPITALIGLTSTATKVGDPAVTSIRAIVEYRPYEPDIDERIRVNSWRVCDRADCSTEATPPAPVCPSGSPAWTESYYNNMSLSPPVALSRTSVPLSLAYDWGTGSPGTGVASDNFSARFTRTVVLPSSGMYRFTVGTDDGQRFSVNGTQVLNHWVQQSYTAGTRTVDVMITDPCNVTLELQYFEQTINARVSVTWVKL
jgi:Tfp pilus assembly protein PilX